jgi:hypothetical protein
MSHEFAGGRLNDFGEDNPLPMVINGQYKPIEKVGSA